MVKCIEDEIPFELPIGWAWCRLSMIGTTNIGLTYKPTDIAEKGTMVLRSCNIKNGKIDLSDLIRVNTSIRDNQYIENNDILICARNGSKALVGKCAILQGFEEKASFGAFMAIFRSSCYQYVYHFLNTAFFRLTFDNDDSKQINQLTQAMLRDALIPLPPFAEQQRIVLKLSELLALVEDIDEGVDNIEELIAATKSKILDLAIRGKLVPQNPEDEPASVLLERIRAEKEELIRQGKIKRDKKESVIFKGEDNSYYEKMGNKLTCIDSEIPYELPKGWEWSRLGTVGEWGAGGTPNRSNAKYFNGNIPWLKTGDLNDGYITNIPESITELALQETSVHINPTGAVLIAMYGATIGKLGILTFPATTNQACCACKAFQGIDNEYLFYYLLSQRDYFINRGVGGAQSNISKEKIVATLIPIPPYNEQKRIIDSIKTLIALISSIEKSLT